MKTRNIMIATISTIIGIGLVARFYDKKVTKAPVGRTEYREKTIDQTIQYATVLHEVKKELLRAKKESGMFPEDINYLTKSVIKKSDIKRLEKEIDQKLITKTPEDVEQEINEEFEQTMLKLKKQIQEF